MNRASKTCQLNKKYKFVSSESPKERRKNVVLKNFEEIMAPNNPSLVRGIHCISFVLLV